MEFASFHLQHQLQEESAHSIASATPPPDSKPSITSHQSWIPSNIYNGCNSGFLTDSFTNSREVQHKHAMTDSLRISTRQALGFHNGKSVAQQPVSDLFAARIKGEMMNTSMKAMEESCSLIPIHEPRYPPSLLPSLGVTGVEFFPSENVFHNEKPIDGKTLSKRYNNFGDASLISNLPTLDMTSSLVSSSLGLNPKMFDLHTSYSESCEIQPCYDTFGLNESIALCHSDMHGRENSPSNSSKLSFSSEVATAKRPSSCSLPKDSEAKAKRSRPSSCPPLKQIRKEKLGDRIQTLQRLVAPFGKTSTASVLSEAIGYIHFLHQQIQTLSIPYMKSTQSNRMVQLSTNKVDKEVKPDLRSRGLCLVPLSYASFIHRCV
ncbi:transcription factor bHLH111 isoform X1 [Vigna angularis]|uniref:transcription factor bHLH111 isoform X1 n=1 Tax=Phaseolus angularis TaxID=3914 RepID=UPI000809CD88|nr:transcription factor bHLH111 isoform X1 [Vigna angularis]XP_017432132.1 transcription factor bHLH111 isoform X1 [Vigna angularis]